jgi:hypothetical protein
MSTQPTTIELTSKRLKLQLLICYAAALIGIIGGAATSKKKEDRQPGERQSPAFAIMLTLGIMGAVVTKARIWWNHK